MQTFNEDVEIIGSLDVLGTQDETQLEVQGVASQSAPLQTWQDNGSQVLGQITYDGRLELGDLDLGTPDGLIEANRDITLPSTVPPRGVQSQGKVTGNGTNVIDGAIAWAVHELELLGDAVVSGVHAALRGKITRKNTSTSPQAELRAADFEAINDTASGANPVGKLVGVQSAVTNEQGAHLADAVGVAVKIADDNTPGQITNAYGLRIDPIPAGPGAAYAIHTGEGSVHVGDDLEVKVFDNPPVENPPSGYIKVYPRLDGGIPKLYAKDSDAVEHLLGGDGGASDFLDLTDTPAAYTSQAGKLVAVTTDESGLEFLDHAVPVVARYTTDGGASIPDTTIVVVNFEDQVYDSHAAVSVESAPATWKFTAPVAGYYHVQSKVQLDANAGWAAGEIFILMLYKNDTLYSLMDRRMTNISGTYATVEGGSDVYLADGEYIDIRVFQSSGGTVNLLTEGYENYIDIHRIAPAYVTAGGGAPTVTKKTIQTRTVLHDEALASDGTFDVQNLSQDYDHLELVLVARSPASTGDTGVVQFNGDTTDTNYSSVLHLGGSTEGNQRIEWGNLSVIAGANADAGSFSYFKMFIADYTNTSRRKTAIVQGTSRDTSTTQYAWRTDIEWESTAAISRITIKGYATANLLAGSHLQIIGVKEENVVTDIAGNLGTLVNFTDLDDVPTAYANQAGKLVAVKSDESGLEFVAAEGVPIVARYHTDQGQSIPDSLYTIVDFEDVDFDPYGLVTTGANWAFTVPVTGYYLVTALLRFNGASWTVTQQAEMAVWVNNLSASYAALDLRQMNVTGGYIVTLEGSTVIYVAKNDVVNIKVFQSIGAALALVPYPKWNHVSIARIVG